MGNKIYIEVDTRQKLNMSLPAEDRPYTVKYKKEVYYCKNAEEVRKLELPYADIVFGKFVKPDIQPIRFV